MSHSSSAVNTIRKPSPSTYITDQNNNLIDTGKGIFGVSLEESVKHASGSLKLGKRLDQDGNPIILGKIPVIVANCAHFLKTSNAKRVEGIFRVSGSARRIKELQAILTDPLRNYGKDLDWSPYTVHDAANLLRRYLNNLPEPIVPLEFYEKFRNPLLSSPCVVGHLQGGNSISATTPPTSAAISPVVKDANANELPQISVLPPLNLDAELSSAKLSAPATTETTDQANPTPAQVNPYQTTPQVSQIPQISVDDTDHKFDKIQYQKETDEAIVQYKQLIDQLPILNQQVLLYILDLLYFFAQNAKENLMPAVNLAAIFQPSLLSHPNHDMSPKEYHLSRAVVQFLIEHFPKLTPSIETWIKYGSKLRESTPTPSQSQSSLEPPGSRRHSKSMSSVNIPPSIRDYISKAPTTATSKPPGGSLAESAAEQTLDPQSPPLALTQSSPRTSPQSTEKTHSNLFKALTRGNSFSRRRTSSTSTTSSGINMEHQNASDTSLTRQNTLSALVKEKNNLISNTSILSEEVDDVATTPKDDAPPHKTASSVTITPKRKPVSKGPSRVPVLTATDANGASAAAAASSEPDHSEGDDAGKPSTNSEKHKVKRKSVSGLFTRRSNSPALSLGQLSLRNRSGSKSSVVNPAETVSPTLSTEMRRSIDSQSSGSPPSQSLVGLSGVHSIDSASSVGVESEDEVNHKGGSLLESPASGESRGRSSRWRRSLIALKIPIGSPDATSRSPGRSPEEKRLSILGFSSDHGSTVSVDGSSAAAVAGGGAGIEGAMSSGRRILRKLNNHRRNRSAASHTSATSEGATTSGAAETSDDALST